MEIIRRFRPAAMVAFLTALLVLPNVSGAQSAATPELRFLFAFGAVTGPEDKPKVVAVQNETVLRSGDRLKFFIEPKTGMSVYLFHQAADGELTVILPADGQGAALSPGAAVYVPVAANWLQLDQQTGLEKFHLARLGAAAGAAGDPARPARDPDRQIGRALLRRGDPQRSQAGPAQEPQPRRPGRKAGPHRGQPERTGGRRHAAGHHPPGQRHHGGRGVLQQDLHH